MMRKYPQSFFVGYILVFMLVTVGIFNLIMAIFIDNVMTNQLERKQRDLSETADDTEVAIMEHLCRLLLASKSQLIPADARVRAQFECVSSADVVISRDAFRDFLRVLEGADVDIHNKTMLFDLMDADMGGSLSANEVFFGLMKLRGPPTKGDIIGISLRVTHIAQLVQEWSTKARMSWDKLVCCLAYLVFYKTDIKPIRMSTSVFESGNMLFLPIRLYGTVCCLFFQ
eukprot:g31160.t1